MWPFRRVRKLPLWLKMFSSSWGKDPEEIAQRIATALHEGKEVIMMRGQEPISITYKDGVIKITEIKNYKWSIDV